ncbi:hypothetical protein LX32DRAFT_691075 [Colletotrichum zoysiae]|uniref:Uncharacterized protein n=1 Tax=Colletotrichum zoysiae TaxID=1216348 RepID=A0AAD9HNJ8_9PEZI|nr:hypothetical protein LX32DRAFT_691075 [Colletotrichum zoysiae]
MSANDTPNVGATATGGNPNTTSSTNVMTVAKVNQVTRAADWTPHNTSADEIDETHLPIGQLWYKIREKKDKLAGGQANQQEIDKQFRKEWAACMTAGYISMHKNGFMRAGVDYAVFLGLKKMYMNTYGINIVTWNEHHKHKFPTPEKHTPPFDDSYSEWLRIEKPEFFKEHEKEILERDQQSAQPSHQPTQPSQQPAATKLTSLSDAPTHTTKLAPTAKPFVLATHPEQEGATQQNKALARVPIVNTPLSSTPQAVKKPLNSMEMYIESTRGYLSSVFKDLGLDPKILEPGARPFETAVPGNVKQHLWFKQGSLMKEAHRCIGKDLRIAWIDRDGKTFLMPYLAETVDPQSFDSWHEFVTLWRNLRAFCSYMATAKSPCTLADFLKQRNWVNARLSAAQTIQEQVKKAVEPTPKTETPPPPPESPRTRETRMLREELADVIDHAALKVIRESVDMINKRTKKLDEIVQYGPHTTKKYGWGALISEKEILDRVRKLWDDHAALEPEPAEAKNEAHSWWWEHKNRLEGTVQETDKQTGGIMDFHWADPAEEK